MTNVMKNVEDRWIWRYFA